MQSLATIGYEGAVLAGFIETLRAAGVTRVIDVREVPLSRKRGFSKRSLAAALAEAGVGYEHLRALGDPKPGREAARRGDQQAFLQIYTTHLSGPQPQAALDAAAALAAEAPSCLMCFERNYLDCHRTIVAKALAQRGGLELRHLVVPVA